MVAVSKRSDKENMGFGPKYCVFDPVLLVCLEEICSFDLCSPFDWFYWMQNKILHRMVLVSKGPPRENMGLEGADTVFLVLFY
jgi:hypothetical protein